MYNPHFNYSDKMVLNLTKAENSKTLLNSTDLSYNVRYKLTQHAKAQEIFYMANILKLQISYKDAEKLIAGSKLEGVEEPRATILKNFKNVLDFNRSNAADSYAELDLSLIMHINKLMLMQWRETWEANLRSFNDKIDNRWDTLVEYADLTIPVKEIPEALNELIEWYKLSVPTIAPLVRIAVLLYRLIEIAPFVAGNKFAIIGIVDYIMLRNGYSSKSFMSLTKLVANEGERFEKAVMAAKQAKDLSNFIDTFTSLVTKELINAREEINKFIMEDEKSKKQPFLNLNKRQLKVLKYLQSVPTIKREDYCHMMEVSTMTAFRDLNDLVRKKLIRVDGKGRGTKYKLASM